MEARRITKRMRTAAMGAVIALALLSCGKNDRATGQDPPVRAAPTWQVAEGDRVTYAVGNPHFRGRTTVVVTHDGAATVSSERAGKTNRYDGKLDAGALTRFWATLAQNDPRTFSSARETASPDEARMEITLVAGGTTTTHKYWSAEQHKIPALGKLVARFNEIATTISKGKVTY